MLPRYLLALSALLACMGVAEDAVASGPRAGELPTPSPTEPATDSSSTRPLLFGGDEVVHTQVALGRRYDFVTHDGYDPYSNDNVLGQFTVQAKHVLLAGGPWSLAVTAGWDFGGSDSTVRGQATELSMYRLSAGGEARYHLLPWAFAFGRVAPGLLSVSTTLNSGSAGVELQDQAYGFSLDSTLGLQVALFGRRGASERGVRLWGVVEGGYSLASKQEVRLSPVDDAGPERVAEQRLPDVAVGGATLQASLALTF